MGQPGYHKKTQRKIKLVALICDPPAVFRDFGVRFYLSKLLERFVLGSL